MKRLIAIGDIHGHYKELRNLITQTKPDTNTRYVFLGDYGDRGPNTYSVIEYLVEFSGYYDCIFIRGNHDEFLIGALEGIESDGLMFYRNGGFATLESYGARDLEQLRVQMPESHLAFLKLTQLSYQQNHFLFVHAGVRPRVPLEDQSKKDLLWIRDEYLEFDYPIPGKTVVSGHTPQIGAPTIKTGKVLIDGGIAVDYTDEGALVAYDVLNRETWRAYRDI